MNCVGMGMKHSQEGCLVYLLFTSVFPPEFFTSPPAKTRARCVSHVPVMVARGSQVCLVTTQARTFSRAFSVLRVATKHTWRGVHAFLQGEM